MLLSSDKHKCIDARYFFSARTALRVVLYKIVGWTMLVRFPHTQADRNLRDNTVWFFIQGSQGVHVQTILVPTLVPLRKDLLS